MPTTVKPVVQASVHDDMILEQLLEWKLAGETEVLGIKLSHLHFVHYKFIMTRHGIEPGLPVRLLTG
jgi:hypothetical protein